MKLAKILPAKLFKQRKSRSIARSDTDPSSSSYSSSEEAFKKPNGSSTPISVLPASSSGDWPEISADVYYELKQAFEMIDRDGDGKIEKEELERLLCRLAAEPPSQEDLNLMLSEVDSDGDGCISLEEFFAIGAAFAPPACDVELRDTFDFFDTDRDGRITAEELLEVFKTIGDAGCTLEDCRRMIRGRAELIRSVLQGVECYWIQMVPLPETVIDRINGVLRRFLWGGKMCPIAWKKVCLPRGEGGLGLRYLSSWNLALKAKILWDIHAKTDSLWIRWVHTEFLRTRDIWTIDRSVRDSTLMRNIIDIRDRLVFDCAGDIAKAKSLLENWFSHKGTAAAYHHFREKGERRFWHRAIWNPYIPPRFSTTLWMALQGRLKTVDRLKFSDLPQVCVLCKSHNESNDHLFFKCRATCQVWESIKSWIQADRRMSTIASAIKWFKKESRGSRIIRRAREIALGATVNHLWCARNQLIFDNKLFDPHGVVKAIKEDVYRILYSLYDIHDVFGHLGRG